MSARPRSISFASSAAATLLALFLSAKAAVAVDCPTTLAEQTDPAVLQQLIGEIDASATGVSTGDPANDKRIILDRGEDIPSIIRENLVNPLGLPNVALAGAYIGAYQDAGTHDFLNLPDDERVLCLLVPGVELFLTDDVTHHYDSVFSVDLPGGTATLLDPWAKSSFLLPGRNLAGVEATITERGERQPLLNVKLPELRNVLRGMVQWYLPVDMMAAIEALFPDLAATPDYLAWKYGVLIGSGSFDAGAFAVEHLAQKTAGSGNEDLAALQRAGSDLYPGLMTGFTNRTDGEAGFKADIPVFAARLPFTVRWLLARRLVEFGHLELAISFLRANVEAHPDDVDFRVALAETLAKAGDAKAAQDELAAARKQWRADVKSMIVAENEDEAVAYFLPHVKDTMSFRLFQYRYERMLLLDARLRFALSGDRAGLDEVADYFKTYGTSAFLAGFSEELLLTLHQIDGPAGEAGLIDGLTALADPHERDFAADSVFAHFTKIADLDSEPEAAAALARAPDFATQACEKGREGTRLIGENGDYRRSFDAFCVGRTSADPAEGPPDPKTP